MKTNYFFIWMFVFTALTYIGCSEKKQCEGTITVIDFPKALKDCITADEEKALRKKTKTWNEVWDAMKARCPDVAQHDNGAGCFALTIFSEGILVQSKADMILKLKKFVKDKKCCIKKLRISGHGRSGLISVGDGQKTVDCQHINGDAAALAKWKKDLKGLKDILCKDATILLDACSTGQGETGLKKMQEIAKEYGVTVIAATGTCTGNPPVEDLPDDKKRVVKPPVKQPADPPKGELDELNKKNASTLRERMKPATITPFRGPVKSLGIWSCDSESIPNASTNPELPISDPVWIESFMFTAIDTIMLTDLVPYQFESSALVLIQYQDGSYQYGHGIYGNELYMISGDKGFMILYSVTMTGKELFNQGILRSK